MGPNNRSFLGKPRDPDRLQLDPAYGSLLPAGTSVSSRREVNDNIERFGLSKNFSLSVTYLTNAGYPAFSQIPDREDEEVFLIYSDEVGKIRVHYVECWPEPQPLAFIGIQKGNTLVPDPSLDMPPVFRELESLEAIVKEDSDTLILGSVCILIGAAALLILGLAIIIKDIKRSRSELQDAPEDLPDFLKD